MLDAPGWYANLHADGEEYVVFPGTVFRYPRDDDARHEEAVAHALSVGVPIEQCDWR